MYEQYEQPAFQNEKQCVYCKRTHHREYNICPYCGYSYTTKEVCESKNLKRYLIERGYGPGHGPGGPGGPDDTPPGPGPGGPGGSGGSGGG